MSLDNIASRLSRYIREDDPLYTEFIWIVRDRMEHKQLVGVVRATGQ